MALSPRAKAAPAPSDERLLDAYPRRGAVEWDVVEDRVVIALPGRPSAIERLVRRFVPAPDARFLTLDEMGTHAWLALDGATRVRDLARLLREKHREAAEPAESRAARFVAGLAQRGLARVFEAPTLDGEDRRGFTPERGYVHAACEKCGVARPLKAQAGARYICPACGKLARVPR